MLTLPSCLRRNRPPRFLLPVFTALTLLAAALLPPATAAPGDLDPTFGIGGKMTTDISTNSPDAALSVALQSDGKILVAGFSIGLNNDFALARYTSTGVLDTAFGDNFGKSTTAIGSGHDRGHSVAVQSDGKILVAGYSFIGSNNDFALVRYTSTGALDTTFGAGGKVTTPIGSGNDTGYSVAVQSNGRILVAGTSSNGGNDDFALARYWSTGALDTTFGTGGKVITPIGSGNDTGLCMAVQSDGKIIVAGSAHNGINNDFALVRYTSTGALDTTFGTGGKVITAPLHYASTSGQLYGVAVQSDGKIVVTGFTTDVRGYTDIVLVRYTSEGALDTSFNNSGKVITPLGRIDENEIGYAVALQNDGKLLVAGVAGGPNTGGRRFALLRYTSAGTLDTSFGGGDGVVTTSVGSYDEGRAIAVQSDGRIVVAGSSSSSDFALVRYQGDEELPVLPPEIVVSGSGVIIANGDTTPSTADGTSFGTLSSPGETLERTFAITNNGTTPLTLTGNVPNYVTLSGSSDFRVTTQAATPVAPGATTTFTVTFAPSTRGMQSATVSIANSDADENPSTFRIQGVVPEAEITVRGNGLNISAGDTSPRAADNTDFGNVSVEGTSKGERTFTILNSGPAQLDLTGNAPNYVTLSGSSDFTVTTQPTTPVASNGTTSFTISFNPSSTGLKTATVSIANTDLNEDPYTFVIQGTGSLPMPGDLDFAFGGGTGKVTTSIGSTSDYGRSVAVQNDDKIVVAGYSFNGSNNDFALARYTSMGALDTSFGNGGKVTTPIGSSSDDRGNSVAVQSDGKIVVAGYIFNGSNADFALARYTSTGALDTSFGNGGKVTTPMGPANDYGYSVAVQSDGKIVMGGNPPTAVTPTLHWCATRARGRWTQPSGTEAR